MESVVLPNIVDETERMRAQDELPQSSPGPVIMTAEPKFVPAKQPVLWSVKMKCHSKFD